MLSAHLRPQLSVVALALVPLACSTSSDGSGDFGEFRSACGDPPAVAPNADGDSNPRGYLELQCDLAAGEEFAGIVVREYSWGSMDGIGLVCRRPDGSTRTDIGVDIDPGNPVQPLVEYVCPDGEVPEGVAYKDAAPYPGVPDDTADSATVICAGAALPNPELDANPAPLQSVTCAAGQTAVGVAYVDRDGIYSDLTDAVSVICRADCPSCDEPLTLDDARLVANPDGDTNPRGYLERPCDLDAGEALIGVVVLEYAWGSMDGMGAICRLADGTTRTDVHLDIANSGSGEPLVEYTCPPGERVIGVAYKDAAAYPGVPDDTTDSVTVVCDLSGPVGNPELDANPAALQSFVCDSNEDAIGVAYVDRDGTYSDLTDAATVMCVPRCASSLPLPDFEILAVEEFGCTGSGGDPVVRVTVRNAGTAPGQAWVDVFTGLATPPEIGTLSDIYRLTDTLQPGQQQAMSFAINNGFAEGWVDVLVDTPQIVDELDETNNADYAYLVMPDCSFN